MSINRLFALLVAIQLALVFSMGTVLLFLFNNQSELAATENRRFESNKLADELRQSSDDLTRFARTYAVTGDTKFQEYFEQILSIRNGEEVRPGSMDGIHWDFVAAGITPPVTDGEAKSLEQRMLEAGFSVDEFNLLKKAQTRSDQLARLEAVAMNARRGLFDDGTGSFSRKDKPDTAMATSLMYGTRYHEIKAGIMEPIDTFIKKVEVRTTNEVEQLRKSSRARINTLIGLCLALLATGLLTYLILQRRLIRPVKRMAEVALSVGDGDLSARSGISGKDEIGQLGEELDQTIGKVAHNLEELEKARAIAESRAEELSVERERSEKLLLNVLPAAVAARLKDGEVHIAESFPEVTVLFADIVGFTQLSETIGPRQVVNLLNEIFGLFDEILDDYKLEKIKTIGDCYMVVGGVPKRTATHAQKVANFGLDIENKLAEYCTSTDQLIQLRIGIHTGTVVAGIIGTKKFAYDLWGDVVNTASRMESHGVPGRIQVSEAMHVRLLDDFEFEERGEIDIKGKGSMRTYFLNGRKDH